MKELLQQVLYALEIGKDYADTRRTDEIDYAITALRAALAAPERKMAPVQGWPQGIPWSLHLEAYAAYCKKWSPQPALIDLEGRNCRGGFGTDELDEFIPGWRERASEIAQLRSELAHAAPPAAPAPAMREPLTDEQLARIAVEDEFLLYCDQDSFNEIARAIEAAHGITGASK